MAKKDGLESKIYFQIFNIVSWPSNSGNDLDLAKYQVLVRSTLLLQPGPVRIKNLQ